MANKKQAIKVRRGEVWLVKFDPTVGSEFRKTRPAIVLQNDIANEHGSLVIVAALTSRGEGELYPTEVLIAKGEAGLMQESLILLSQIRTVDKMRFQQCFGKVTLGTMARVDRAIELSLGLVSV